MQILLQQKNILGRILRIILLQLRMSFSGVCVPAQKGFRCVRLLQAKVLYSCYVLFILPWANVSSYYFGGKVSIIQRNEDSFVRHRTVSVSCCGNLSTLNPWVCHPLMLINEISLENFFHIFPLIVFGMTQNIRILRTKIGMIFCWMSSNKIRVCCDEASKYSRIWKYRHPKFFKRCTVVNFNRFVFLLLTATTKLALATVDCILCNKITAECLVGRPRRSWNSRAILKWLPIL